MNFNQIMQTANAYISSHGEKKVLRAGEYQPPSSAGVSNLTSRISLFIKTKMAIKYPSNKLQQYRFAQM